MAFTGTLEERQLIRERYAAYSSTSTRMDLEGWLDNWTEDCRWTVPWATLHGKAALREQTAAIYQALEKIAFFMEVGAIEIEGDTAHCLCHCLEIFYLPDGTRNDLIGLYSDILVRQDGVWRFSVRDYQIHAGTPPMNG
jgi:uncharacterized protein (TIGR02246 family)